MIYQSNSAQMLLIAQLGRSKWSVQWWDRCSHSANMITLLTLLLIITVPLEAIPIDNGVQGEPEIECSSDNIAVNFNTRNEFQGHVYVKGRFNEEGCRNDERGRRVAGIKLSFSACGTRRNRSLNPKGILVTTTLVISFHPQFLTKVDRAYTIQCFYMEADKTVSQEAEVSEITTAFQTQTVPMPVCRYDILEGASTGPPVRYATIGQQVYHKWTCESETADIFCIVVHSCYVDDGAGNRVQLLNEQGCALDKYLLNNLEYQSDLMAGHEAHVFKYADKPALVFQCQITILIKEPGKPCERPQCPEPGGPSQAGPSQTGPSQTGSSGVTRATVAIADAPDSPTGPPTTLSSTTNTTQVTATVPPAPPPPGINGTKRRDPRPIQIRRDFSALASRLLRRARSVWERGAVDAVGTWDVSSQQITAMDVEINGDQGRYSAGVDRQREGYCLAPVSMGLVITLSILTFIGGASSLFALCLKTRQSAKRKRSA